MTHFNYSLDHTNYTLKNALTWGNFRGHCKEVGKGHWTKSTVHLLIAAMEILPIISQIASLMEKFIMNKWNHPSPPSLTHRQVIVETESQKNKSVPTPLTPAIKTAFVLEQEKQKKDLETTTALPQVEEEQVEEEIENPLTDSLNFQNKPGNHTKKSPVVGSRAPELVAFKQAMSSHPGVLTDLDKIFSRETSYKDGSYKDVFYLIPLSEQAPADAWAEKLFSTYIAKYEKDGITAQNMINWTEGFSADSNKLFAYNLENPWNTWRLQPTVQPTDKGYDHDNNVRDGLYLPPHLIALNLVLQMEEMPLGADPSIQQEQGHELVANIQTLIFLDGIYKKMHGIEENSVVHYGHIDINGKQISLGEFANFYRELEATHGKLYQALISPESIAFLKSE